MLYPHNLFEQNNQNISYLLIDSAEPITAQIKNANASTATIVEPTGVPASMDISIPKRVQTTDKTAEKIVTERKL